MELDYRSPTTLSHRPPVGFKIILAVQSICLLLSLVYFVLSFFVGSDVYGPILAIIIGVPATLVQTAICVAPAQSYRQRYGNELPPRINGWLNALSIIPPVLCAAATTVLFLMPHTRGSGC
jgi:hypothetical protein